MADEIKEEKKKPVATSATEPTKNVELRMGEVIVCPKGSKENCFKTTKSDWDRVFSKQDFELSEEKKN